MKAKVNLLRAVRSPRVVNILDLRRLAKQRLPHVVFDYIDGGAEDEVTLRENSRAFRAIHFRPRQSVAVSGCDVRTTVLRTTLELPVLLAPVGFWRAEPNGDTDGEPSAARRAGRDGRRFAVRRDGF